MERRLFEKKARDYLIQRKSREFTSLNSPTVRQAESPTIRVTGSMTNEMTSQEINTFTNQETKF